MWLTNTSCTSLPWPECWVKPWGYFNLSILLTNTCIQVYIFNCCHYFFLSNISQILDVAFLLPVSIFDLLHIFNNGRKRKPDQSCYKQVTYYTCADPESFVRGGPNLITFFCFFFSWWGDRGSKYRYKWAIIGPPAKRHLNGVSLAGRWWPNIECWVGSCDFSGDQDLYC